MRFECIGFDLDGTLLETYRDLGAAVNHALAAGGFDPVPTSDSRDLIGGGAKAMLAKAVEAQGGLPDDAFRPLYKTMLAYYADHNAVHSRPYPGVPETLDALVAKGVTMAVVTNKFEGFARDILAKLGLADHFACIIGGDTMGRGNAKPAAAPVLEAIRRCGAEPARFAFVGDSSYDVGAARNAGVPVVVAAYGYCDAAAAELGGDAVIESFADLPAALEAL